MTKNKTKYILKSEIKREPPKTKNRLKKEPKKITGNPAQGAKAMKEYIELSPTPNAEECKQTGRDSIQEIRAEAQKYADLLKRIYVNFTGVYFTVKTFNHDFGAYCETVVNFNDEDPRGSQNAYFIESNTPDTWKKGEEMTKNPPQEPPLEATEEY